MKVTENEVQEYWTVRAHDFGIVRRNEICDDISLRWAAELRAHLPEGRRLRILDVGTGTGYFAVLLAAMGHEVIGIDLTPAMIDEAGALARERGVEASFAVMDAQEPDFPDSSFDAVVSRNLTWTLPEPEKAYTQWLRVLRSGGVLLNFDASYADNVRNNAKNATHLPKGEVYGHCGITPELESENARITLGMPMSARRRPDWDIAFLRSLGAEKCESDKTVGRRILLQNDLADAPMFLVKAMKK